MAPPTIRLATAADADGIWRVFQAVVRGSDSFPWPPDTSKADALAAWMHPSNTVMVALDESNEIVGSYFLRPVQPGLASHIANAAYMVAPWFRGRGLGKHLGEHSIEEARRSGYLAMQFNLVVSTNLAAVELWQRLGFKIVATIPRAFRHGTLGLVATHIMHRELESK